MQLMMNDDAKYPRNMRPIALSFVFHLLYLLCSLLLSCLFSLIGFVLSASVLRASSLHCLLQYDKFQNKYITYLPNQIMNPKFNFMPSHLHNDNASMLPKFDPLPVLSTLLLQVVYLTFLTPCASSSFSLF